MLKWLMLAAVVGIVIIALGEYVMPAEARRLCDWHTSEVVRLESWLREHGENGNYPAVERLVKHRRSMEHYCAER